MSELLPWLLNWSKKDLFPSMSWILCWVYFSNIWQSYFQQLYCKIKSNFSFWLFSLWKSSFTYFSKLSLFWNIKFSPVMSSHHFPPIFAQYSPPTTIVHKHPMLNVVFKFFITVFFRLKSHIKIQSKTNISGLKPFSPLLLHSLPSLFNSC